MIYQIKIQGRVDPSWSDWFNGMQILQETDARENSVTTLTGPVGDQAALRGILNHIWDLNLAVFSVIRLEPEDFMARL